MSKYICTTTFFDGVLVKRGEIVDRAPDFKSPHLKLIEPEVKAETETETKSKVKPEVKTEMTVEDLMVKKSVKKK